MKHKYFAFLILIPFFIVSCVPGKLFSPTFTPNSTNTLTSTLTATFTPTNHPTLTPTITFTPTSTLSFPLLASTPLPITRPVIALDNIDEITQLAHWGKGNINDFSLSPNGKLLSVASTVGIYFYDAITLQEVNFINSSAIIGSVVFSPDGQTIAAGSWDMAVRLWRVSDGKLLKTIIGNNDSVVALAFSPDGQTLASATASYWDFTVRLWNVADGTLLNSLVGQTQPPNALAFSQDGQTLASASGDGIRLWRSSDGKLIRTLHGRVNWVDCVAFSPDGQILVAGTTDGIEIWRLSDGALLNTLIGSNNRISSVAFSPDGQTLASYQSGGHLQLWRVSDWTVIRTVGDVSNGSGKVVFSPDGQSLVLAINGFLSGSSETIRLFRVSDGTILQEVKWDNLSPSSVAFSPDSQTMAVGDSDTIRLLRVSDGMVLRILQGQAYTSAVSVAFSQDGQTLASAMSFGCLDCGHPEYNKIQLWRVSDGTLLQSITTNYRISSVAFSPDGQSVASGTVDGVVRLWSVSDGKMIMLFQGHQGAINSLAFSPDGQILASGSSDKTVRLWHVKDGTLLHVLAGQQGEVDSVAFSPDGLTLASGSERFQSTWDGHVTLWNVKDGSLINTFVQDWRGGNAIFSPDGKILMSLSTGGTVKMWSTSDGSMLRTIDGYVWWVRPYAFSPDGTVFAAVSSFDGSIILWGINSLSTTFRKTTPISTLEFLPEPSLYDDFESADLDTMRWQPADSSGASQFSYLQKDGALVLEGNKKDEASAFEIDMTKPDLRTINQVRVFEAQMKIPERSSGNWSFITMKIGTKLSDQRLWTTQCFLTGLTSETPSFGCNVYTSINGQSTYEPSTDGINVKFDQWYTIRIELNPANGAIQWYLDGKLVELYIPKDASALPNSQFTTSFGIWTDKLTSLKAEIDNVRITGGTQP